MRYNEHQVQPEKKPKPEKKEEPRILAGNKDYDYSNLGKNKPMKGGNSWS